MHRWAEGVTVAFDRKNQALLIKFLLRGFATEVVAIPAITARQISDEIEKRDSGITREQVEAISSQEPTISALDWETRNRVQGCKFNVHTNGFVADLHLTNGVVIALAMSPAVAHVFRILIQRALEQLGIQTTPSSRPN